MSGVEYEEANQSGITVSAQSQHEQLPVSEQLSPFTPLTIPAYSGIVLGYKCELGFVVCYACGQMQLVEQTEVATSEAAPHLYTVSHQGQVFTLQLAGEQGTTANTPSIRNFT